MLALTTPATCATVAFAGAVWMARTRFQVSAPAHTSCSPGSLRIAQGQDGGEAARLEHVLGQRGVRAAALEWLGCAGVPVDADDQRDPFGAALRRMGHLARPKHGKGDEYENPRSKLEHG